MIGANALVVHLNPLQELVQPKVSRADKEVLAQITELAKTIDVPLIVKEVGAGISKEVAIKLEMANVSAINIAGAGGTSWAGVEKLRAESLRDDLKKHLGEMFWDWGIPTASSLLEVRHTVKLPAHRIRWAAQWARNCKVCSAWCQHGRMAYPFLQAARAVTRKPVCICRYNSCRA